MTSTTARLGNLSASYSGTKVASVRGSTMAIWDLTSYELVNTFPVLFEHGDYRITISNDGNTVAVGTWREHGVGAYDTASGREIWRRKDLKRSHRLIVSRDDLRVFCEFEDLAFRSLNLFTGKERTPLRGVEQIHESRFDDVLVQDRKKKKTSLLLGAAAKKIAELPRSHWGPPAITFGPGLVCMGGAETKCYSTTNCKLVWQKSLTDELNEVSLACHTITYSERHSEFDLVVWPDSRGGDYRFVRLDSRTGDLKNTSKIEASSEFKFCLAGTILLTTAGSVYQTSDLQLIGSLPIAQFAPDSAD